ncbi:hypothetical protein LXA43DRAFT_120791 [Ganoderma leucocontextum]|nr:hypothetical protein LXA43DRAFT_120791 [Ganoderma leucocontextum]
MSSICPCLIILAAGPMLQINAVYLTDYVYLTPMAHLLLQLVPGTTDAYDTKLARQLQVVRNTVQMLAQSYAENHTGAHRGPGYLFPAPCVTPETGAAWTPGGGFEGFSLNFKDDYFTTEFRAVFRGEIIIRAGPPPPPHQHAAPAPASPSRVPVYIKFAPQYGEEVHNLLYKHGFAPQLRWCGRVCGGPIMVVMDEMKGSTIQASLANHELVTDADLKPVDDALSLLGERGFVHGDLRPSNVILQPMPDGSKKAYIINFDCAGKAGEARYPYGPYWRVLRWPCFPDELFYQLITHEHDKNMRSWLLEPNPSATPTSEPSRKRSQPDSDSDPDPERVVRPRVEATVTM